MRTETFATPAPPRLRINLSAGHVELEAVETAETRVELDGPREDEALIELRGDELIVDVERKKLFGWGQGEHRLRISAPLGAVVDVTTASADVQGRGRYGGLSAKTASGDVQFSEIAGDVDAKTASGDVQISDVAGDAEVSTASGDVQIASIGGETRVRSASGDVQIGTLESGASVQTASGAQALGSVARGSVSLQSASGDMKIGIRRGSRLWIDARSLAGSTTSELEVGDAPADEDGPLVELRAKTMSGDIRVVRA